MDEKGSTYPWPDPCVPLPLPLPLCPHVLLMHACHAGQLHVSVQVGGSNSNSPAETRPEFELLTSRA